MFWSLADSARLAWGIRDHYDALAWSIAGERAHLTESRRKELELRGALKGKPETPLFLWLALAAGVAGVVDEESRTKQASWSSAKWKTSAHELSGSAVLTAIANNAAERLALETRMLGEVAARDIIGASTSSLKYKMPGEDKSTRLDAVLTALTATQTLPEMYKQTEHLEKLLSQSWLQRADVITQSTWNEGQIISIEEKAGDGDMIARVPEPDACSKCIELFVSPLGTLNLFSATQLLRDAHTTEGQMAASSSPVHPHCRCWVLHVPKGYYATRDGGIVKDETGNAPGVPLGDDDGQ